MSIMGIDCSIRERIVELCYLIISSYIKIIWFKKIELEQCILNLWVWYTSVQVSGHRVSSPMSTGYLTIGAFVCSGFSWPKWISVAKLRKSVTEKRDPKKHLSQIATEAREQNSATEIFFQKFWSRARKCSYWDLILSHPDGVRRSQKFAYWSLLMHTTFPRVHH